MCGIAGYIRENRASAETVRAMALAISHRGPDASAEWLDPTRSLALAHRRLAIIDLSQYGAQPMTSSSGRWVVCYNGEIYNYQELKRELEGFGVQFRGSSDTEVLVEAIERWGILRSLERLNGMFAFAVYDTQNEVLTLARDRVGIKPLYYGWQGPNFFFASELHAIRAHPEFRGEVDRDVLCSFFRHQCTPGHFSIYRNIYKLAPGTILDIPLRACSQGEPQSFSPFPSGTAGSPQSYWNVLKNAVDRKLYQSTDLSYIESIIEDAVKIRMVADVPLGSFLSGGIDSSLVSALMQKNSMKPVKTFSIGFQEEEYNEAVYAKQVANHLGSDHYELYVSERDALRVVPELFNIYDEPFADASQIPTYLLSKMTREHVTVSLSGDGGDEGFYGYSRYQLLSKLWNISRGLPGPIRRVTAQFIRMVPSSKWEFVYSILKPLIPTIYQVQEPGEKLHRVSDILDYRDAAHYYRSIISHFRDPESLVINGVDKDLQYLQSHEISLSNSISECMMQIDKLVYLPDDILTKVDRASMAVSLEARVPLLDHRLVELAAKLPFEMLQSGGRSKWALREILSKYVPNELIDRPKQGFGIPLAKWLRGDLRDWAESLLERRNIDEQGYLNSQIVHDLWDRHQRGERNNSALLWDVLMFQAWLGR